MTAAGLHINVAERGKVCALGGDHVTALMHYREAMAMAIREQSPPVLVRHYLECALESLEHMGAYSEVLKYCERAIEHYQQNPPEGPLPQLDLASIHQRQGIVLLKQGDREGATRTFDVACNLARAAGAHLPLADTLLRWLRAQLTITADRIASEQERHHYYSVRPSTVKTALNPHLAKGRVSHAR
jgi:hypothetical protein